MKILPTNKLPHFLPMHILQVAIFLFLLLPLDLQAWPISFFRGSRIGYTRQINPKECTVRTTGETGICMFAFYCMKMKGRHLGPCVDRYLVGSCCKLESNASHAVTPIPDVNNEISETDIVPVFPLDSTVSLTIAVTPSGQKPGDSVIEMESQTPPGILHSSSFSNTSTSASTTPGTIVSSTSSTLKTNGTFGTIESDASNNSTHHLNFPGIDISGEHKYPHIETNTMNETSSHTSVSQTPDQDTLLLSSVNDTFQSESGVKTVGVVESNITSSNEEQSIIFPIGEGEEVMPEVSFPSIAGTQNESISVGLPDFVTYPQHAMDDSEEQLDSQQVKPFTTEDIPVDHQTGQNKTLTEESDHILDESKEQDHIEYKPQKPDHIQPDSQQQDHVQPEYQQHDHMQPESQQSVHEQPDSQTSDHIYPVPQQSVHAESESQDPEDLKTEIQQPDHLQPETQQPDHLQPETQHPDHLQPESQQYDRLQPERQQPDHSQPDMQEPDHSQPETQQPNHSQPDTQEPNHSQPEMHQPHHSQSETQQHDHSQPETQQPDHSQPERQQPESQLPDHLQPEIQQPDHLQPDHLQPTPQTPETQQPDHSQPETQQPDHSQPESQQPDNLQPDTQQPDHSQPETQQPDHSQTDMHQPHHSQPETQQPDHSQPETQQADHSQPDMHSPHHSQPETQQADHSQPDMHQPHHSQPETQQPHHTQPETQQPDHSQPESQLPDHLQPETQQPDHLQPNDLRPTPQTPESPQPDHLQPETQQSDHLQPTKQPETHQPDYLQPDMQQLDHAQPETQQPDHLQPETQQPETLQSDYLQHETQQPDHLQPETQQPDHLQPETQQPDHLQPETQQPDHLQPEVQQSDHLKPETQQSDHLQTETQQSDHLQPETQQSDHLQHETQQSDHLQHETQQSDHLQHETQQSDHLQHETQQSDHLQHETQQPDHSHPETEQPDHSQPETQQPDHSQPETQQPDHSQPETQQPDNSQPETQQSDYSQPEIQQPDHSQLEIQQPNHLQSTTQKLDHLQPESQQPEQLQPEIKPESQDQENLQSDLLEPDHMQPLPDQADNVQPDPHQPDYVEPDPENPDPLQPDHQQIAPHQPEDPLTEDSGHNHPQPIDQLQSDQQQPDQEVLQYPTGNTSTHLPIDTLEMTQTENALLNISLSENEIDYEVDTGVIGGVGTNNLPSRPDIFQQNNVTESSVSKVSPSDELGHTITESVSSNDIQQVAGIEIITQPPNFNPNASQDGLEKPDSIFPHDVSIGGPGVDDPQIAVTIQVDAGNGSQQTGEPTTPPSVVQESSETDPAVFEIEEPSVFETTPIPPSTQVSEGSDDGIEVTTTSPTSSVAASPELTTLPNSWNEVVITINNVTAPPTTTSTISTTEQPLSSESPVITSEIEGQSNFTTTLRPLTAAEQEEKLLEMLKTSSYQEICGKPVYPSSRVVGGYEASFGEWPWQVSFRQWRSVAFLHKCGAAIVNENWAITAAHCVEGIEPDQLLLVMGEYDLGRTTEPFGHVERRVQVIAMHPKFEPRTFEYDLALLRFAEPVVFQPNIIPICIPDDDYNYLNETGYVTGWGRLYEDGPLPTVMQKVPVPVIPNENCEEMYKEAGYIEHIPNIFICAGYQSGKQDSCEGDSGGPMVIYHENRWQLAGIISWGIGCAVPNQPGVYTRISEFRDWINKIIIF